MNAKTKAAVRKHGNEIKKIFGLTGDPVILCKKLRKLERQGAALGLRLCNGPEYPEGEEDRLYADILGKVNDLLGNTSGKIPVFINLDPRGYALKIRDDWVRDNAPEMHKDWGSYGILAPDLTENK